MSLLLRIINKISRERELKKYKNIAPGCRIPANLIISNRDNLIMQEGAELEPGTTILNVNAKFEMGRFSGAGPNLTVIAGNHMSVLGKYLLQVTEEDKKIYDPEGKQDQDVVLEDDVWLGANVLLLNGVRIGRGAIVAAGTVCRTKIPPYAIVAGNPAKVVGFRFTPEQILEHESKLYPEEERLPVKMLEKNYKKYFLNRLSEINQYCKL